MVFSERIRDDIDAMRTIGRILIFVGASVGVFGMLVLGTKWGPRDYGVRAGYIGGNALLWALGLLSAGIALCWFFRRPELGLVKPVKPWRRGRKGRKKVPAPHKPIVLIGNYVMWVGPPAIFIIMMWVASWKDSKGSSKSWRLSSILGLVILTVLGFLATRAVLRWSLRSHRQIVDPDLLEPDE